MSFARAEMYYALADALAAPPEWLARPGREWPLYKAAKELAGESEAARSALALFGEIPAEPMPEREKRYHALFSGDGRPDLWLYESLHRHGSMLSAETVDLEKIYRAAGLERAGAELPDHASIELTFLAYSAERQIVDGERASDWRLVERRFIQKHAGCWLPELGRSLAQTGDCVYGPIGLVLWRWISEVSRPAARKKSTKPHHKSLPSLKQRDCCTLCGFCVQVCPVRALAIHETAEETRLLLDPATCLGCRKCVPICETGALSMIERPSNGCDPAGGWTLLRVSPRVQCPACRRPTVSRAEYEYVVRQIGRRRWLDYCLDCRTRYVER